MRIISTADSVAERRLSSAVRSAATLGLALRRSSSDQRSPASPLPSVPWACVCALISPGMSSRSRASITCGVGGGGQARAAPPRGSPRPRGGRRRAPRDARAGSGRGRPGRPGRGATQPRDLPLTPTPSPQPSPHWGEGMRLQPSPLRGEGRVRGASSAWRRRGRIREPDPLIGGVDAVAAQQITSVRELRPPATPRGRARARAARTSYRWAPVSHMRRQTRRRPAPSRPGGVATTGAR